ncbi:hypothetical protein [Pseudarthrobacter sulfonivorans]|uniref:hypothetical protein n=1 Tax=Pseudarthrobacter sulfonivorans TaxID=121292 RepID=UPI0021038754|nr:hypothetical protein [Pseudarthrobacter sulfonivorans]
MLAVAAACSLTGLVLGYPYLAELALWLVINFACLLGGFLIHEGAHALAGRRFRGISSFVVSSSMFRFSIAPVGRLYGWQIAVMALAGPVAAAAAGLVLWAAVPGLLLHWWFWPHLVFLAPLFGDGRSLVVGIRHWSARVPLHAQPPEAAGEAQ